MYAGLSKVGMCTSLVYLLIPGVPIFVISIVCVSFKNASGCMENGFGQNALGSMANVEVNLLAKGKEKERERKGKGKERKGKGKERERKGKGKERKGKGKERERERKGKERERKGKGKERKGKGKERERKGKERERKGKPNHYGHFVDGTRRLSFYDSVSIQDLAQASKSKHLISWVCHHKSNAYRIRFNVHTVVSCYPIMTFIHS
jgi:hypothetical protein